MYYFLVFLHILAAAIWIGGMFFLVLVILPVIKNYPDRVILLEKSGLKFRTIGWIMFVIILITGLLNLHFRGIPLTLEFFTSKGYGQLVSLKILIFSVILIISAYHDFYIGTRATQALQSGENKELSKKYKAIARWSGRLNLLLGLTALFLGVALARGGF